jgi:hypothetical protein
MSNNAAKIDQRVNQILRDAWRMKPSDLSVLDAAMQRGSGILLTNRDSDNDRLWSQLVELGLMRVTTLPPEFAHVADGKAFELVDKGRERLPLLFDILKLARVRMQLQQVEDEMARKTLALMA